MAEPPFHMPGHRWDATKKRFFKDKPGSVAPTLGHSEPPEAQSASGTSHVPSAALRLPAFVAGPSRRSAFGTSRTDPVSLRSNGVRSRGIELDRQAVRSAYSQLVLLQARSLGGAIHFMQTDTSSDTILVLFGRNTLVRLSPCHGTKECIVGNRLSRPLVMLSEANRHLWILYEAPEPYDLVEYTIPEPIEHRLLPEERDIDVAMPNSVLLVVGHKTNLKGIRACALHTLASVSTEDDVQRQMAFCHDHTFSLATISNRLTEWSSAHSSKRVKSDSDTTAVAFSSCGTKVYIGYRSGKIAVKVCKHPAATLDFFHVQGTGAVTNLGVVNNVVVVVWTSGEVRLVDASTSEVVRSYDGHRNSYLFNLGFALEPKLRLLALAGIDNKVRIWSLDDSQPLETSAARMPRSSRTLTSWGSLDDLEHAVEGSVLSSIRFPDVVNCLHWSPRVSFDVGAGALNATRCSPWSDLYVACGTWIYHFRWP